MNSSERIDEVLVQWGDRLFYPGNRVKRSSTPRLKAQSLGMRAAEMRERIAATVVRRAPQAMVKVTGGGRGMLAIAAHFRYISKNGRLDVEDERGHCLRGKDALHDLVDDWRWGGSLIEEVGTRREAFNVMLSMPRGTDPLTVLRAAREFARQELADHKYVMVLHDHQANPHVHLSVRAESKHGKRLNPRKNDLNRWRETFAEKLRGWGIDAEASRQAVRRGGHHYDPLWHRKAAEEERLAVIPARKRVRVPAPKTEMEVGRAWSQIADALNASPDFGDKAMARSVEPLVGRMREGRGPYHASSEGRETPRTR
jgi:hypothetical protein